MAPGLRSAGLPMAGSILPPLVTPWRGSSPTARSCGAKASRVARLNPPKETGVAMSIMRASPPRTGSRRGIRRVRSRSLSARAARWAEAAGGGDGVLGKREGHCHRPDEFAVDVNRAPAHALHDAGVFQRSAGEAGEDEGFLGADIVEHAQDFDLEVLDFVPVIDCAAGAAHS